MNHDLQLTVLAAPSGQPDWTNAHTIAQHKVSVAQISALDPENWKQTPGHGLAGTDEPDHSQLGVIYGQLDEDLKELRQLTESPEAEQGPLRRYKEDRLVLYITGGTRIAAMGEIADPQCESLHRLIMRLQETGVLRAAGFRLLHPS